MIPRNQRAYLAAYYAVLAAVGLMAGVLGPVLPTLAENTHSSLQSVSLILAMRPAGYMLGTLASGRAMDRMPGHPVLMLALALAGAGFALMPQLSALSGLAALVFVFGLADGILDVGANTLLPWVFGDKSGPYFNGLHFAFGVGALCAPLLIARSVALSGSISWAFNLMALLMLPLALYLKFIPSPKHEAPPAQAGSLKTDQPLDRRALGLMLVIFMAYGGSETAFAGWIFSYAWKSGLETELRSSLLTSVFWASLTLGRLAGIAIALHVPLKKILALDALGCVLSLGAMLLWPSSRSALWLGSAGAGLFMASFFPTLLAYAGARLSPQGRLSGKLVSFFFVASSTGSMMLPWLIGQGFERIGPICAIAALFGALSLMSLALWPLLKGAPQAKP